jgi:hypothetical protein
MSNESHELKRGTGSFILHGKKASVITMSGDWQAMSNDERLRLRTDQMVPSSNSDQKKEEQEDTGTEDGTVVEPTAIDSMDGRRQSTAIAASVAATTENEDEDDFVDAKTSVEAHRMSVYNDAKETRSRGSCEVDSGVENEDGDEITNAINDESDASESDLEETAELSPKSKARDGQ